MTKKDYVIRGVIFHSNDNYHHFFEAESDEEAVKKAEYFMKRDYLVQYSIYKLMPLS